MERDYSDETAKDVRTQTRDIFKQFRNSPNFTSMFKYCQKEAEDVIFQFSNFAYMYDLYLPEEWTLDVFTGQAYNVQRKCMYPKAFFKAIPKVIYHFAKYCAENSIGQFTLEDAEEFREDLKDGMYEDTFHSDWEAGSREREKAYRTFYGD